MNFIKTSIYTALSTLVKVFSNVFISKVVALTLGPSGLALLGQLSNFIGIIRIVSAGGITNGVTKSVAEYEKEPSKFFSVLNVSLKIIFVSSLFINIVLFVFKKEIGLWIFNSTNYNYFFKIIRFSILFLAMNVTFFSILIGLKKIKLFVLASVFSNVVGLLFTLILMYSLKLKGLIIAFALNQSIGFLFTLWICRNEFWVKACFWKKRIDFSMLFKLLKFSLMSIVSAVTIPVVMLSIRNHIINVYSIDIAGYWEGVNRISFIVILLLSTSIQSYLIPSFSAAVEKDIPLILKQVLPKVLMVSIILSFGIWLFRDVIILILYSKDFLDFSYLLKFQLIGDVLRIMAWVFGYLIIGKGLVFYHILNEILFSVVFLIFVYFPLLPSVESITLAYLIACFTSLLFQIIIFRKYLYKMIFQLN